MKVKALVSFSGIISMRIGEERDIKKGEVLTDLLNANYVEKIKSAKDEEDDKSEIKDQQTEETPIEEDDKGVKADEN